ncbi:MAG: hypothetical protein M3P39_00625, partial [Actinomycetota bacterium]|nr:hypothetical protein [Actinomycetota bacterium]
MAEHDGARAAAGEHGRPQAPAGRQARVADGVDAAVEGVQAAPLPAVLDRARLQAEGTQLPDRHHAVLAASELRERPLVGWDEKSLRIKVFSSHPREGGGAPAAGGVAPRCCDARDANASRSRAQRRAPG